MHKGKITSISDEYGSNSKHVSVTVRHGKRKRSKTDGSLIDHDRPTSHVVLPRSQAKQFSHGQSVNVGLTPATDADGDDDGDAMDDDVMPPPAPTGRAQESALPPSGKKSAKAKSRILGAMTRGKKNR